METDVQAAGVATMPRPQQIDFPGFPITAEDTVVDVGCGEGLVCAFAGHQGAEVIGIDVEPHLVERAREAMRGVPARSFRGIVSDADPIPLPDGCATVVVATEVMEHVEDPRRFLAELARIGRPGARYLISVPDPASESVLRVVAPRWYWQRPLHIHVFEHRELDALIASAGLEAEARHAAGFYWAMWWAFRLAIGMDHPFAPTPPSPLLQAWDDTMLALLETPDGEKVLRALDRLLPKSQVVVARKPLVASSFGGPTWVRRRLRRALRDGMLHLGGFDLRWQVRRAKPPASGPGS
jgi:SAM-dependent methyltransferase